MHLGAAERLVVGLLAGGHLHQRRTAEEDLGLLLHHHGVVAHAGHVGATRGGVAEDQRDRRLLAGAGAGEVAEQLAAGDEDLLLRRQVRAPGLHERDRGQPVLLGDLRGPEDLLDRPRVRGAALHRRVVGADHHLDALDDADAGDDAGADREVRAPRGERGELEERGALVDEQLDALAGQQLAAGVVAGDGLLPAAGDRLGLLGVQRGDLLQHRLAVGRGRGGGLDVRSPRSLLDHLCVGGGVAHFSSTAFIFSSVVRMPFSLVLPRAQPSSSQ